VCPVPLILVVECGAGSCLILLMSAFVIAAPLACDQVGHLAWRVKLETGDGGGHAGSGKCVWFVSGRPCSMMVSIPVL
jgi:hypothetical protein